MKIYLDGTERKHGRIKVLVDEGVYWVPSVVFKALLRLCVAHPDWVHKHTFGGGEVATKYLYRLRKIVPVNIENSRGGGVDKHYRIVADSISINTEAFVNHYDYEVREMVSGGGLPPKKKELVSESL